MPFMTSCQRPHTHAHIARIRSKEERRGLLLGDTTLSRFVRFLNHDTSLQKPLPFGLFSPGSCVFLTAPLNHAHFEAPSSQFML